MGHVKLCDSFRSKIRRNTYQNVKRKQGESGPDL
jgi:hypothetical protein